MQTELSCVSVEKYLLSICEGLDLSLACTHEQSIPRVYIHTHIQTHKILKEKTKRKCTDLKFTIYNMLVNVLI
jgi:hypothetical protein